MSGSVWIPPSGWIIESGQVPNPPTYAPGDWSCGYVDLGCGFIDITSYQVASGAVVCGCIQSGQIWNPTVVVENVICGSPVIGNYDLLRYCCKCGRCMGSYYVTGDGIQVTGVCGFIETWCWQCAGYRYQGGGFETREDWLREGSPFASDTPCWLMADWYEEQGRCKDAEWLRIHRSGK